MVGATMQHHLDLLAANVNRTVQALRENTYVDNITQVGCDATELEKFKLEATEILESAKLPLKSGNRMWKPYKTKTCLTHQRPLV